MGLRERYLSSLDARCVVAVPRERNTQQPLKLLRVAPPMGTQHATTAPAQSTSAAAAPLRATRDATAAQQAQRADREAKIKRSASRSAEAVPYWVGDDMAGWTEKEIVNFKQRVARSTWLGYSDAEGRAERLRHRDHDVDDRRLCVECLYAGPGWSCTRREAFLLDQLQRCPMFKEKPL